jgi:hypothetical protein
VAAGRAARSVVVPVVVHEDLLRRRLLIGLLKKTCLRLWLRLLVVVAAGVDRGGCERIRWLN